VSPTLEQAARQALEALRDLVSDSGKYDESDIPAIARLEQALKQQAEGEPLADLPQLPEPDFRDGHGNKTVTDYWGRHQMQEYALAYCRFYKRRMEALQQWQSKMRDPERTIVCDILANGCTLEPAGNRYTRSQPVAWVDAQVRGEMAKAVHAAIRRAVPNLGPWSAFDADEVQAMADALTPFACRQPAAPAITIETLAETMANAECAADEDNWRYMRDGERKTWLSAARVASTLLATAPAQPDWSGLGCNGPLCGLPEHFGGHHPLCKHAATQAQPAPCEAQQTKAL
jgi:hypothetical protein